MARFRADPRKVRIGVRNEGDVYRAVVVGRTTRDRYDRTVVRHKDPCVAVMDALKIARSWGVEGIDLDMRWVYDHPYHDR